MSRPSQYFFKKIRPAKTTGFLILCLCFLLGLTSGCLNLKKWYHPQKKPSDFALDHRECELIAEQAAKDRSLSGKKINFEVYQKAYNSCLLRKGWANHPQQRPSGATNQDSQWIQVSWDKNARRLKGPGNCCNIPDTFSLDETETAVQGNLSTRIYSFADKNGIYLKLYFQKSQGTDFEKSPFPVTEPFFRYDAGYNREFDFSWSVFCGKFKGNWVAGLGSYRLFSDEQRLIAVLTAPLPAPETDPPPGLRLSKAQYQAIEKFLEQNLAWYQNLVAPRPGS